MAAPFTGVPSLDPAAQLNSRLVSYGRATPKSLVSEPDHTFAVPSSSLLAAAHLAPPARPKRPGDAATGSINATGGGSMSSLRRDRGANLKAALGADPSLSAPLLFSKKARSAPLAATNDLAASTALFTAAAPDVPSTAPTAELQRDPFWFIAMLRTELSEHEFAYMNVADAEGTSWDPYKLRIVPFNDANPANHFTISQAGVTHCIRHGKQEVVEFTPLEQWETECAQFQEVWPTPRPCATTNTQSFSSCLF